MSLSGFRKHIEKKQLRIAEKKKHTIKPETIPEKVIENQIMAYLNLKKIYAWKNQSVGVWDQNRKIFRKPNNKNHIKGVSDILGILPCGRFLAIEVKSKTGKLSPDQVLFIERINSHGGLAFMAQSIEDVENKLLEIKGVT